MAVLGLTRQFSIYSTYSSASPKNIAPLTGFPWTTLHPDGILTEAVADSLLRKWFIILLNPVLKSFSRSSKVVDYKSDLS